MKIPKDLAERVATGTMRELWEIFITLEGEYKEFQDDYNKARYGVKVEFPIYWLWKETNKIVLKPKDNAIMIDGDHYDEDLFEIEKEKRRKIMVEAILENSSDLEVVSPR